MNVHFSSKTPEWATPQAFFDRLNEEFHFDLDPCATPENAKCKTYFTSEQNGLAQDWTGARVFCNPPYGRGIGAWVQKCAGGGFCDRSRTHPGAYRYRVVARLHPRQIGGPIYTRSTQIRRLQKQCTLSERSSYLAMI